MSDTPLPVASAARTGAWFLAQLRGHKLELTGTARGVTAEQRAALTLERTDAELRARDSLARLPRR